MMKRALFAGIFLSTILFIALAVTVYAGTAALPVAQPAVETAAQETINVILGTTVKTPEAEFTAVSTPAFGTPFSLLVMFDHDSLTLLIPADQQVSLEEFTVSVLGRSSLRLDQLGALDGLKPFYAIQAPKCIHLERIGTTRSIPQSCQDNDPVVRSIDRADIGWYDPTTGAISGIQILRDTTLIDTCDNPDEWCLIQYTPPLPSTIVRTPDGSKTPEPAGRAVFEIAGDDALTKTTLCVQAGDTIRVEADGIVKVGQYVGSVDPDGTDSGFMGLPLGDSYDLERGFPHGALMCRVDAEERWQMCGKEHEFVAAQSGCLEFEINDNDQPNNSGEFTVTVTIN